MTEAELLTAVTGLCGELGLLWHHCSDSRTCHGTKGFPDLVIAGRHGVLIPELKADTGETTAEQDLWIWTLELTGRTPFPLWRPADLRSGRIRAELERLT